MSPAPQSGVRFDLVFNGFPKMRERVNARARYSEHELKERIAEEARARVRVKTGATRDSITVTDEGVEAGEAAVFLEFGTRRQEAHPFLGASVEASKPHIEEAFRGLFHVT
jgi:HK97 gp10 family phage protein